MKESTGRRQHRRKITGAFIVVGLMLMTLLNVMPAANAVPSITWQPLRPGQNETDRYSWTEASRTMSLSAPDFGSGAFSALPAVFASDHDPTAGYPWPYCQPIDACPFRAGVYATLSEGGGVATGDAAYGWYQRWRINSEDDQGARPALACDESNSGMTCDAAFVKQSSYYDSKVGKGPRSLFVTHNANYGYRTDYGVPVELTSPNGKVDYPSIDVSSGKTFVTWTNGKTGEIMLAISSDGGVTWDMDAVAKTTREAYGPYPYAAGGYEGRPALAVSNDGMTIGIAYFKKTWRWDATIRAKLSQDGGATWTSKRLAKSDANPNPHYGNVPYAHGTAGRLGFAWTNGTKVHYREFDAVAGQWQPKRTAATLPMGIYKNVDSTAVALEGTDRIGIAFGGCLAKDCPLWGKAAKGKDLLYTESDDGGLTWMTPAVIKVSDDRDFVNDMASIVFDGPTVRYVRFNSGQADGYNYETQTAVGLG